MPEWVGTADGKFGTAIYGMPEDTEAFLKDTYYPEHGPDGDENSFRQAKTEPQQTPGEQSFHIGQAVPNPEDTDELQYFGRIIALWNTITIGRGAHQSVQASLYHSGGGIYIIDTPLGNGYYLWWGTCCETWGADLYDPKGEYVRSVSLEIRNDYPDVLRVVSCMYDMVCAILDGEVE